MVVPHNSNLFGTVCGPSVPARYVVIPAAPPQSPDEDCTLEEEEEAPVEEEDDIDQFNDDTFGAGAIGKCFCLSNVCHKDSLRILPRMYSTSYYVTYVSNSRRYAPVFVSKPQRQSQSLIMPSWITF